MRKGSALIAGPEDGGLVGRKKVADRPAGSKNRLSLAPRRCPDPEFTAYSNDNDNRWTPDVAQASTGANTLTFP